MPRTLGTVTQGRRHEGFFLFDTANRVACSRIFQTTSDADLANKYSQPAVSTRKRCSCGGDLTKVLLTVEDPRNSREALIWPAKACLPCQAIMVGRDPNYKKPAVDHV